MEDTLKKIEDCKKEIDRLLTVVQSFDRDEQDARTKRLMELRREIRKLNLSLRMKPNA